MSAQRLIVSLDRLDATLDLNFSDGDCICSRMASPPGAAFLFSGARANTGLVSGKCYFKVQVGPALPTGVRSVEGLRTDYQCRIGVSRANTPVGHLGEVSSKSLHWDMQGIGYTR